MLHSTVIELIRGVDPVEAWRMRWHFVADANGDGQITISDVGLWIGYFFFIPGDVLLLSIMRWLPGFAAFMEMTPKLIYGWWSGIISGFVWLTFIGNLVKEHQEAKAKRARR
jgi:hypothetical protein